MKVSTPALASLILTQWGLSWIEAKDIPRRRMTVGSVTTGPFDTDAFQGLKSHHEKHQNRFKSESVSLSLDLPNLTSDGEGDDIHIDFECEAKSESFHVCTDTNERRRLGDGEAPKTQAFIGRNGPYVSGLITAPKVRYEIRSHIIRDDDGKVVDVVQSYAAAKASKVGYEHEAVPVEKKRKVEETDDLPDEVRKLVEERRKEFKARKLSESAIDSLDMKIAPTQRRLGDDDGSEISLLMYYTKRAACQWLEEDYPCTLDSAALSSLENHANTFVSYSNEVLERSEIDFVFKMAKAAVDPDYDEGDDGSNRIMLDHLTDRDDGELEDAHTLRDEVSADLVVGFMASYSSPGYVSASGVAWVPDDFPSRDYGFSMTGGDYPYLSSVGLHEIGHNLGLLHHRSQCEDVFGNYNYGYADCSDGGDNCWVTIMSYSDVCYDKGCSDVDTIDYFSNPNVKYNGVKTGTSGKMDNALTLSKTKIGASMHAYEGQKVFEKEVRESYYTADTLMFEVKAKTDITINNFEIQPDDDSPSAARVKVSYALNLAYDEANMFKESKWTTAGDETITPLSALNEFMVPLYVFSNNLGIFVPEGDKVTIRIQLFGGGEFWMESASQTTVGSFVKGNDDFKLFAGQRGYMNDANDIGSTPQALDSSLVYSTGTSPTGPTGPTGPTTPSPTPASSCDDGENLVTVQIKTDGYGAETYWFLKQYRAGTGRFFNVKRVKPDTYGDNETYITDMCVKQNKCYKFVIKDTNKDGLCCDYGDGRWKVSENGVTLKTKNMENKKKQSYQWGDNCP